MQQYRDHPMNLADASLAVMAETEHLRRVFTIDRTDFATYRIKHGHRNQAFQVIGPAAPA